MDLRLFLVLMSRSVVDWAQSTKQLTSLQMIPETVQIWLSPDSITTVPHSVPGYLDRDGSANGINLGLSGLIEADVHVGLPAPLKIETPRLLPQWNLVIRHYLIITGSRASSALFSRDIDNRGHSRQVQLAAGSKG